MACKCIGAGMGSGKGFEQIQMFDEVLERPQAVAELEFHDAVLGVEFQRVETRAELVRQVRQLAQLPGLGVHGLPRLT